MIEDKNSIESMGQTERMRLATIIERITNTDDKSFSAGDAACLFSSLEGMSLTNIKLGVSTTVSGGSSGPMTDAGLQLDDDEKKKYNFNIGKVREFRCGTCVITRTSKDQLEVRRVCNTNALANDGEIVMLKRLGNGKYQLLLNKPYILDWPFLPTVVIAGVFKHWKSSRLDSVEHA